MNPLIKYAPTLLLMIFSAHVMAVPTNLSFQGRLLKSSVPVVSSTVDVTIKVVSPTSPECLLFEEEHHLNMTGSDGIFNINIGSGTRTSNDKGLTLAQVFSNTGVAITGLSCPATSYTPTTSHVRNVYVTFYDGVDTVSFDDPFVMQSVPYAIEAEKLAGKSSTDYLQINNSGSTALTQANLEAVFTTPGYTYLQALLSGSIGSGGGGGGGTTGLALGSATAPTISFIGDTNTGIFSPAADTVAVTTGGSERIRIDSAGHVGIGLTTPTEALHLTDNNNMRIDNAHLYLSTGSGGMKMGQFNPGAPAAGQTTGIFLSSGSTISWSADFFNPTFQNSVYLASDNGAQLAQRNGTNAQQFNIYNTYTSTTDYERAELNWLSNPNVFTIQTAKGSAGGTVRNIALQPDGNGNVGIGTTTPAAPLTIDKTVTGYETLFEAKANGKTEFLVTGAGQTWDVPMELKNLGNGNSYFGMYPGNWNETGFAFQTNCGGVGCGVGIPRNKYLSFWTGAAAPSSSDVSIKADETGVLAQHQFTDPQAYRLYNTFTDASNYERAAIDWRTTSNVLRISTEAAGTGTVRPIALMGGNVGIGTTSPTELLHLKGTGYGTGNILIEAPTNPNHRLYLYSGEAGPIMKSEFDGNESFELYYNSNPPNSGVKVEYGTRNSSISDATYSANMEFAPRGQLGTITSLFMNHLGNVGIGTNTPSSNLTVAAKSSQTGYDSLFQINNADDNIVMQVKYDHVNDWEQRLIFPDIGLGYLAIGPNNGGNTIDWMHGGSGTFKIGTGNTSDIELNAGGALSLHIDGTNQNVGIGVANPSYKLDVDGDIRIALASSLYVGTTVVCDNTGCTIAPSDRRYKENIQPLENAFDNILKIQGVSYDWIDKQAFNDKHQIGLIAQDLEQVYPEVVRTDEKTGYKSVMYDKLVAPLIEAFKTLASKFKDIDSKLDREIAAVKAENVRIKAEAERLKIENDLIKARLDKIEKALH